MDVLEHHPNNQSLLGNGGKLDSVEDSFLVNGKFLEPESPPVHKSPAVSGIIAVDNEALSAKDDSPKIASNASQLVHDAVGVTGVADFRNDATFDSSPTTLQNGKSDFTVFQDDAMFVSSPPRVEESNNTSLLSPKLFVSSPRVEENSPKSNNTSLFVSSQRVEENSPKSNNTSLLSPKVFVSPPRVEENSPEYNGTSIMSPKLFVSSPRIEVSSPLSNIASILSPKLSLSRFSFRSQPSVDSPKDTETSVAKKRIQIDTAAPIESVKHAVSKFGGILDWKAHRALTMEKRQIIEQELERVYTEIPAYKNLCETAEDAKKQILKELDTIKRLIEELKIQQEKVQTEELQAKQDAELAKLRVEEMEQGIAGDSSVAAKAQLEVAKARYAAAVSELKNVKDELEALRKDYAVLLTERDNTVIKAQEAVSVSTKVEKELEDLTIELMTVKESLQSAHAAHLETEEHRISAAEKRKQETLKLEEEMRQAEEEVERLNNKVLLRKELKSKLDSTSVLLKNLKDELATYMKSKPNEEQENGTRAGIQAAVDTAREQLAEVKMNIEKATSEVESLQVEATSLKKEVESEKARVFTLKEKEGKALVASASLEAEIKLIKSKISDVKTEEKSARDKMLELHNQLEEVAQEAEQANLVVCIIREKVEKAKEETEQGKAEASNMQSRLLLAQKEIEAAKNSEKLALAAINAMHESETARKSKTSDDSPTGVNLSLEQYYDLSKQAHDAEEEANNRVAAAMAQIDVAKESELRNLNKLEELGREMDEERAALKIAVEKEEKAKEAKLAVEQELRQWRSEHEQKRKETTDPDSELSKSPRTSFEEDDETESFDSASDEGKLHNKHSPKAHLSGAKPLTEASREVNTTKKKKKSFFPRFLLFFAKKKSHHSKAELSHSKP